VHHRKNIRLQGYDYSQAGGYYVTIVMPERECLFGEIVGEEMILNEAGKMVEKWWNVLPDKFPSVTADAFVVMPNHFHGIIFITVGADLRVGPGSVEMGDGSEKGEHVGSPLQDDGMDNQMGAHTGAPLPQPNAPLSQIVQWFKTMTTNEYIRGVKQLHWMPFIGKLWQRNYYEHIIRNEGDYERIFNYIATNPSNWAEDEENR
jgi:REP element-mobilizing transposase RayT